MTRWLSDDEQRVWRAFLRAIRGLDEALDAQLQRDAAIPHTYYEILVRLSEAPGRTMRMSELASGTQSSRSRLSHAVARLEERGWITRKRCTTDRRGQEAVLTDEGFAALADAAPGHAERVRTAVIEPLSRTQQRQLEEISTAIVKALQEP